MKTFERVALPGAGVELAADAAGPQQGPPIVFLPGSGQTRQSWHKALLEAARLGYRGYALDLRGHGDSGWSPDGAYSLDLFAADLRQVMRHIGGEPVLVGASLGGLASLLVASAAPPEARALILVDVTPRVDGSGAREVVDFMSGAAAGFATLDEAADAVASYLPHRPRPRDNSGLLRNLRLRNGRYHWHWDPAFMRMGEAARAANYQYGGPGPLDAAARALRIPTLLIRGGRSQIVTEESAREFLQMAPHAEFVDIAGAHHMLAGDANDAFNDAVFGFIGKLAAPAPLCFAV